MTLDPNVRLHYGRSWSGTDLEDDCPCGKAPCGLVDSLLVDENCPQHAVGASKTIRQLHYNIFCPEGI